MKGLKELSIEELEKMLMNLVSSFKGREKTPEYIKMFNELSSEIKSRL